MIIKIKGINFRIWIKNASRCNFWHKNPQKRVQIEQKMEEGPDIKEDQLALLECRSAHGKCQLALPKCQLAQIWGLARNLLINIKPILFDFLGIITYSNSYMILFSLFFKHPPSINKGKRSEIRAFFSNFFAPLTLKTF